jgi:hypothetical protein
MRGGVYVPLSVHPRRVRAKKNIASDGSWTGFLPLREYTGNKIIKMILTASPHWQEPRED